MTEKRDVRYLSRAELEQLRSAIHSRRDALILNILYETGCTVHELINIKIAQIDLGKHTIFFAEETSRSKTSRMCYISDSLSKVIAEFTRGRDDEYLFSTRQSGCMTTKRVRQIVQMYTLEILGERINPHTLRYTHIAHALERSIPLHVIQQQVGIESLRAVQLAQVLAPKKKEESYEQFFEQ